MAPLNLFYSEPDFDRWLPFDRFPRRIVRRILRGPSRPGGQMRVFLNLCAGLGQAGIPYRTNNYRHARLHPDELCCVLGKRHVLDAFSLPNPLMVGPGCHNHPIDAPALSQDSRVARILVPGPWMQRMCQPQWGEKVFAWPVGIDTERWSPSSAPKSIDFLFYNKIRWDHARREQSLLAPLRSELQRRQLTFFEIRYGSYRPEEFQALLAKARAMIFLCEHETQGIAYQEALSSGIPILAWDHGGEWLDPEYHPARVRFGPVSSVPYWSPACGEKFAAAAEFPPVLDTFLQRLQAGAYDPRGFIQGTLELKAAAKAFATHAGEALETARLTCSR